MGHSRQKFCFPLFTERKRIKKSAFDIGLKMLMGKALKLLVYISILVQGKRSTPNYKVNDETK